MQASLPHSVFVVQGTTNIKGELFFFAIKRKVPLIPLKEKNASDICSLFSLFSLHEMSLDISNPCGNMFLAVAGFKDNLRTSPPRNATLVQSW